MSINYTFRLCYGFQIDRQEVENSFVTKEHDAGEFHMEDRFDPKTGAKVEPAKIWDRKPSTKKWVEYQGNKIDGLDMEEWEQLLKEEFGCGVESMGSYSSGEMSYAFFVNKLSLYKDADDHGNITVYNDVIDNADIPWLMVQAAFLKEKLEKRGFQVSNPKIFITTTIS